MYLQGGSGQYWSATLISVTKGDPVTDAVPRVFVTVGANNQYEGAGLIDNMGNGEYRYHLNPADVSGDNVHIQMTADGCFARDAELLPGVPTPPFEPTPLTVQEVDGVPSVPNVTTLQFDQARGFIITSPADGVAKVQIAVATTAQQGIVSTGNQTWAGAKSTVGDVAALNDTGGNVKATLTSGPNPAVSLKNGTQTGAVGLLPTMTTYLSAVNGSSNGSVRLDLNAATFYLTIPANPSGFQPSFAVQNLAGTMFTGQWGFLPDGSQVSGGLITSIGSGGGGYTNEMAQDAVAAAFAAGTSVSAAVTYNDSANSFSVALVNDQATPGATMLYGTDATGVKGWYAQPSGGGGVTSVTAGAGLTGSGTTGAVTLGVDFGTGHSQVRPGDDPAYTDARNPTGHGASHWWSGSDAVPLDMLAAPSDVTLNNASASAHGLLPKLPADATKYLDGTGAWSVPPTPPPSGAAGGDLSGTYPNPTVAKVQGRVVSATAPADGQLMGWSAGSAFWGPVTLAGDVNGSAVSNALALHVVTNAKLATAGANSIKGNPTGIAATVIDMSPAQLTNMLPAFAAAGGSAAAGIVPSPGATAHPNTLFDLRDNGTWSLHQGQVVGAICVPTDEICNTTGFTDLATADSTNVTLDVTALVLVRYLASCYGDAAARQMWSGIHVAGVLAGNGDTLVSAPVANYYTFTGIELIVRLNAGTTAVSVRHKVDGGACHFTRRSLTVTVIAP